MTCTYIQAMKSFHNSTVFSNAMERFVFSSSVFLSGTGVSIAVLTTARTMATVSRSFRNMVRSMRSNQPENYEYSQSSILGKYATVRSMRSIKPHSHEYPRSRVLVTPTRSMRSIKPQGFQYPRSSFKTSSIPGKVMQDTRRTGTDDPYPDTRRKMFQNQSNQVLILSTISSCHIYFNYFISLTFDCLYLAVFDPLLLLFESSCFVTLTCT